MNFAKSIVTAGLLLMATGSTTADEYDTAVDPYSYKLGIIGAFSEVVRLGVKKLALSEVMSADETDAMMHDAQVVAERNHVLLYREKDLLVSDLYPADVARGKHVLLIYTGSTLDSYFALKADKKALIDKGEYEGVAREEIARSFGRLLSYPEQVIDDLIAGNKSTQ